LKACGVVTAAETKRNPFVGKISREISACRLVSRAAFVIAPAQFVDQIFKAGGSLQGLGAQVASQPLAHSIANRSAGGSIDRLAGVVGSATHHWFRLMSAW
jgi:hypothetical protein